MTHVITQSCCNDAACVDVCPVDCIHPRSDERGFDRTDMLYIDGRACVDCGACVDICPASAIFADHELTEAQSPYLAIAKDYFSERETHSVPAVEPRPVPAFPRTGALRVAIVGTGPAACYAARQLAHLDGIDVRVSMFDRLPLFGGLVRHGVAPDHQRTKASIGAFERDLPEASVSMFLNVEIGHHLSHEELLQAHHAVIYAVGASSGQSLGIPGEGLAGSWTATDIVGWYNGHPDHVGTSFDTTARRAVVIGNGNIAIDVARILLTGSDLRKGSDIAEHAREALARSRMEEVVIIGRRGPQETAATFPELMALGRLPGVDVLVESAPADIARIAAPVFGARRRSALLAHYAAHVPTKGNRRIVFRYFLSPHAIEGDEKVESILLVGNALSPDGNLLADGRSERLACDLVVTSVGYRGVPVSDLPFDSARGTIPNFEGRVVGADGKALAGAYTSGWAKRGPSGVIGTNKRCSAETVAHLLEDFAAGALAEPHIDLRTFGELVARRQPDWVDRNGWRAIDRHERAAARHGERGRIKLVDVERMLEIALPARPTLSGTV